VEIKVIDEGYLTKFKERLKENKILISSITDFEMGEERQDKHQFILNYSSIDINKLDKIMKKIKEIL